MKVFQFKKFKVLHEKSAHKVGTDGVLLGAWTSIEHKPERILDIGSGSGLIALIMAQRYEAGQIDTVEINENAYLESKHNFQASAWSKRLNCYHVDIKNYNANLKYDLILSNPPFFDVSKQDNSNSRIQARKQLSLSEEDLLKSALSLLKKSGYFSTILPFNKHEFFIEKAEQIGLNLNKLTHVKGHKDSSIKRTLMQFGFRKKPLIKDELILEISRHQYTEAYSNLVKDFYLNL